jgi:hypothetical protein
VAEQVPGAAWPIRETLALIVGMAAGAALVVSLKHLKLPRRGTLQAIPQPA